MADRRALDRDQSSARGELKVLVATTNRHKLQEIIDILGPQADSAAFELISLDDLNAPVGVPEEPGETFEQVAIQKALYYARASGLPTIADDSGLVVDALDGAPGAHSSRWMGEHTSYRVKNEKLVELLSGIDPERRGARFVCVAAMAWPDGRVVVGHGLHEGRIHEAISGTGGFGYDPVFYSLEAGQTFGTLSANDKNRLSHRARALYALRNRIFGPASLS